MMSFRRRVILLNSSLPPAARHEALAHTLGHLDHGHTPAAGRDEFAPWQEREADEAAAEAVA